MQQLGVKAAKSCIFCELAPKIRHEKALLHGKRLVTGFSGRSLTTLPCQAKRLEPQPIQKANFAKSPFCCTRWGF